MNQPGKVMVSTSESIILTSEVGTFFLSERCATRPYRRLGRTGNVRNSAVPATWGLLAKVSGALASSIMMAHHHCAGPDPPRAAPGPHGPRGAV